MPGNSDPWLTKSCSIYLTFLRRALSARIACTKAQTQSPLSQSTVTSTQSVLFPTPHKKDLRLKWVSVPLWQQCFYWRHTMHRKGTKKTTEKWHLVLLGHKLGRKPSRVSCSSVAFCIILCCLMPQFRCSVCSLRVLGWSTWSLPHRGGYRQTDAESLSIPSYNFSLHPTFPVLSNSSPPAGQDHGTSGRHNKGETYL